MLRIHVRLDLEDDSGKCLFGRSNHSLLGRLGSGWRHEIHDRVEHFANAEVVDGRAEEDRRLFGCDERIAIERFGGAAHQFDLLLGLRPFSSEPGGRSGVRGREQFVVGDPILARSKQPDAVAAQRQSEQGAGAGQR